MSSRPDQPRATSADPAQRPGTWKGTARPGNSADLGEPTPARYANSAERPEGEAYQWPRHIERAFAVTAYDDEAGTFTIGDHLHGRRPTLADQWWLDRAHPRLETLARAGVHGDLDAHATDYFAQGETWGGTLTMPGGSTLRVESSENGFTVGREWIADTAPEQMAPLARAAAHREILERQVKDELRTVHTLLPGTGARHRLAVYQPDSIRHEGALAALMLHPQRITTLYVEPDGGVRLQAPHGLHTYDSALWLLAAQQMGLRGGRKAGTPEMARVAVQAAVDRARSQSDVVSLSGDLPHS